MGARGGLKVTAKRGLLHSRRLDEAAAHSAAALDLATAKQERQHDRGPCGATKEAGAARRRETEALRLSARLTMRARARHLALPACLLCMGSAHAYGVSPIGPAAWIGLLLGAGLGLLVAVALAVKYCRPRLIDGLTVLLGVPLAVVIGAYGGFVVGMVLDYRWSANFGREATEYRELPLRKAACSGDAVQVRRILAESLDRKTRRELGYVVFDCALNPPQQHALLRDLAPALHRLYVQGQRAQRFDYCRIVDVSIGGLNVEALKALKSLGLPLDCDDGDSRLELKHFLDYRHTPIDRVRTAQVLELLLAEPRAPLRSFRTLYGETMLDRVIDRHDPLFIEAALRAGIDPGRVAGAEWGLRPAVLRWVVRKFRDCQDCPVEPAQRMSAEQIAAIDRLMREPTTEEINRRDVKRFGNPVLYEIQWFGRHPDGGAAFFSYLKARGADLGVVAGKGFAGLLSEPTQTHPALIAELEKLSPAELQRLAHPAVPGSGEKGKPLLETARRDNNHSLVAFLCGRGIDGCMPP